jgi:tetratricopeptide (TPR) repeat protein
MKTGKRLNPNHYLKLCREQLETVHSSGDQSQVCMAMANLGHALFQVRKYEEGMKNFDQAIYLALSLQDIPLQVNCLGIKTLAFQEIGRLPDAFETAGKILEISEQTSDLKLKCNALTSQGQILLDSGEPMMAFELLRDARQIAHEIGDQRCLMNALGALGNFSIAVVDADQAEAYFTKAQELAIELGDRRAESGFLSNRGTVLAWRGKYIRAADAFRQALSYFQETDDQPAEIRTIQQIVKIYNQIEDDAKVLEYARRGFELTKHQDSAVSYVFLEMLIQASYRMKDTNTAHETTMEAIAYAHSQHDSGKEADFQLSLGESYLSIQQPDQALNLYQDALRKVIQLDRQKDEAYLTGRIGLSLAELGRLDEAMEYHQQAIDLAQSRGLIALEAEQLSMLAMAYLEKHEIDSAHSCCTAAIEKYAAARLEDGIDQARRLLAEIEAAQRKNY